jgi:hypothetical protein
MKIIVETRNGKWFFLCLVILICSSLSRSAFAQDSTKPARNFKNTVKVNLTAPIIYNNAWQVSYERMINKNQSLNIIVGYNEFPTNLKLDLSNTEFTNSSKKNGYMLGVDYRFYLQKENKYPAPHGIYLAPYFSFYQFNSDRGIEHIDSVGTVHNATSNTKINFFNIGGELGYQFVFGKRWVIDAVVFGPAITKYDFKVKLDGDLGLDENETIQAIVDAMKDKFPLLNDLSKEKQVSGSGHEGFWSFGFRYNISVGFRF